MSTESELDRCRESIDPGSPKQEDGEDGKRVGLKAVAERLPGEATEKREWDQNPAR